MNEFTAKKLGEVVAFAEVSGDTFSRGKEALISVLGEEKFTHFESENQKQVDGILKIAEGGGATEITKTKAEKTGEKLKKMRDLYVGDEWDNATELLEWSGFFEGAAVVHWQLVTGTAETLNNDELKNLAEEGITLHQEFFKIAEKHLKELGAKRSVE